MNPKLAAGIGAVVGMFLTPAAWVALLAPGAPAGPPSTPSTG